MPATRLGARALRTPFNRRTASAVVSRLLVSISRGNRIGATEGVKGSCLGPFGVNTNTSPRLTTGSGLDDFLLFDFINS